MAFVAIAGRDSYPTIAGFVFQVNVTLLRWLELREREHLELECGEDIDIVRNGGSLAGTRVLEQIKARAGRSLTLHSKEALEAVSNFCRHRAANPSQNLRFRYITTATTGFERGWQGSESAIETWTALQRGQYNDVDQRGAIAALRTLLKSCSRPDGVSSGAWQALQRIVASEEDACLLEVVLAFEWSTGCGDYGKSESEVLAALTDAGYATTPEGAKQVYEHLFAFVFRLLCKPGGKLLTIDQLAAELTTPSITQADLGLVQLLKNELDQVAQRVGAVETTMAQQANDVAALKQTVGLIGKNFGFDSPFVLSSFPLSTDVPDQVSPCAPRAVLVGGLLARAQANCTVFLVAEPGSGKTQLLVLALGKAMRRHYWLNINRDATEAGACGLLEALVRSVSGQSASTPFRESCALSAEQFRGTVVVIEDLPRVLPGGQLAARIETLARYLKDVDAYLLVSSYFRLPATTEYALGNIYYDVPRFRIADVGELLAASDAPQSLRTAATCQLIVDICEGLPTLVMAAVRYLANQAWNFTVTEIESLFRGEFASAHRRDAQSLLKVTVPDVEERELLIRLSLAVGAFSMYDIASVALVPKAISLPGEKVQRATGLWLQQVGDGRYLRSPLLTSVLGESLDPKTREDVHSVLARRILARRSLEPIEALACVKHLELAGEMTLATMVVIQALAVFMDPDLPIHDEFAFARMWHSGRLRSDVGVDLQLYLRALQTVVLAKQGRDFLPTLEMLDALIAEVGGEGWGAALATGMLAVHLSGRMPILANKYLPLALRSFESARLPNGSPLPTADYPLENILWMTAYACKSDAEVDSWLATISHFTSAQLDTLKGSELMDDHVTVFCDGISMREYVKPEAERDWNRVKGKLKDVEVTARSVGFSLLEASAVRTRITVLAEWERRLDDALALSDSFLSTCSDEGCRFLVLEVTGRQLSYSDRGEEALILLEKALACRAYRHSLWRRNVLITVAELDATRAVTLATEAVELSRDGQFTDSLQSESLAELGLALAQAGDYARSFELFEEATKRLFANQEETDSWRGSFFRLFAVTEYYSVLALGGKPDDERVEPKQGLFLTSGKRLCASYRPEHNAYMCVRLGMFADGIKDISKAAAWIWKALDLAEQIPAARHVVRLASWLAMPAALLAEDFARAARLAAVMMAVDLDDVSRPVRAAVEAGTPTATSDSGSMAATASARAIRSGLLTIPIVSITLRLAFLQMRGATAAATEASLADIESVIRSDVQPESFVAEMRRALLRETDWQVLRDEGYRAIQIQEYLRGYVLCIGAMDKAPVLRSLYLQTSMAQHFEGLFKTSPSIYREIVAPFFVTYWERTIRQYTGLFRTTQTYTQKQLKLADGSPAGTQKLLAAMQFCLGAKLPESATKWLESAL